MRGTLDRKNLGVIAAATLTVSGCASMRAYDPGPGNRVAAMVVQEAYFTGESVNVTISNLSELELTYPDGFCKTALQRKDGSEWTTISNPAAGCPANVESLDPGQTVVKNYPLPQGIDGGTYRLVLPMPVAEMGAIPEPRLLTPAFKVQRSASR